MAAHNEQKAAGNKQMAACNEQQQGVMNNTSTQ